MSKPLELTIHSKALYDWNSRDGYFLRHGPDKRLTDAELAAEFHFARLDSRVRHARQQYSPSDVYWHHYIKGLDQEAAFERFASLPHYDEQP